MLNVSTGLAIWCSEAATLAGVLYLAWRHDRASLFYLVWSFGFLASGAGFVLAALRGISPDLLSIEIGNLLMFIGPALWICGFRMLHDRKVSWTAFLPAGIWMGGVFLPWINNDIANRVALFYLANSLAGALLMQAIEPRARHQTSTRLQLLIVFGTLSVLSFGVALVIMIHHPTVEDAIRLRSIVAFGNAFLNTAAIALSARLLMERAERRWHAISSTDTLTGVLNRRGLQEAFAEMTSDAAGNGKLAVLLFDLDHFKAINDRHGHQTGDIVLVQFAHLAQQFIAQNGTFGRMGGEEFLALAVVRDEVEAEALAETIRTSFCRVPLLAQKALVPATVSVGIAVTALDAADWDKCVSAADRALYAAKGAGRNCTVIFGENEAAAATDMPPDRNGGDLVPNLDDQIHALKRIGNLSRL